MKHAWIVVADSARARILSAVDPSSALRPVEQLVSPASRMHDRDLTSDKPGRALNSTGKGRHATSGSKTAKEQIAISFAREVADHLDKGRIDNQFERLVIVADPKFLGLLMKSLSGPSKKLVSLRIDKDLSKLSEKELRDHLPTFI
jgi:protein required for attachment to host cells